MDSLGNVYVSDPNDSRVRRIDAASGTISTVAGTGERGYSGDGGPSDVSQAQYPIRGGGGQSRQPLRQLTIRLIGCAALMSPLAPSAR